MKLLKGIIDRIEGEIITIEINGEIQSFTNKEYINKFNEGDVVNIVDKEIIVDKEATLKRREKIKKIIDEMWR